MGHQVVYKTSGVANAGFGLFATRDFKKKDKIAKFVGAPSEYNEHSKYLLSLLTTLR